MKCVCGHASDKHASGLCSMCKCAEFDATKIQYKHILESLTKDEYINILDEVRIIVEGEILSASNEKRRDLLLDRLNTVNKLLSELETVREHYIESND